MQTFENIELLENDVKEGFSIDNRFIFENEKYKLFLVVEDKNIKIWQNESQDQTISINFNNKTVEINFV